MCRIQYNMRIVGNIATSSGPLAHYLSMLGLNLNRVSKRAPGRLRHVQSSSSQQIIEAKDR